MAEGFRAAEAYVEITARLDEDHVLASARRAADGADREMRDGGDRAGRGFTSGLLKVIPQAGTDAASGLIGALSQGLKGPAGPYLIAGLSAGAVVAGPFLGALVAGGIMAGIATAGIGGGVILAAKDPEVKAAWSRTGDTIGDILQDAASPFKAELIEAAGRGTAAFQRWEPMLRQIGGTASTMLDPFVDALEDSGDRLLPSIMTMINNSGPAVDALADGISGTVDAVADVIDMLDDNGPEAAAALNVAFFLLQSSIRNVGMVVNGLTEAFGNLIEGALDSMGFLGDMGEKMAGLPGPLGAIGEKMAGLGGVTDDWRSKWDGLKGGIKGATDEGSDGTAKLDGRTQLLSLSMGGAVQAAGSLSAAFQLLNGGALDARQAESAYQAAIDGVTASMKANGNTLDLSTEKGRANDAAIRQLISSTDAKAQATYNEVEATQGAAAAEAAAAGVYEQGRAQLVKNLTQLLGNATAANKLADEIMGIPTSWTTTATANTATATAAFTTFDKKVKQADGTVINYIVRVTRTGDHHIPGQGTQVKGAATGGPIQGGSGYKDDVPIMAMGGEWMLQKPAVRALQRQFGPDFLSRLNSWHLGGRGGASAPVTADWGADQPGEAQAGWGRPSVGRGPDGLLRGVLRPGSPGYGQESHVVNIGTVTLDASGMKSIQDVVDLISGLQTTSRSYRARTVAVAGR